MSSKTFSNKRAKTCIDAELKREEVPTPVTVIAKPSATTKEELLRKTAEKGQLDISPLKASQTLLNKRNLEDTDTGLKALITVFSLVDINDDKDYGVAALVSGDMFAVREALKKANTEECVVNKETIPMVADCLKPKFVSKQFMDTYGRKIPKNCDNLKMYLKANCEAAWLLYAPYREDRGKGAATVDVGVQLYHYAMAWQRALTGQPIHFAKVDVVNYFIDIDELQVIDELYNTQDPHFGQRRSAFNR